MAKVLQLMNIFRKSLIVIGLIIVIFLLAYKFLYKSKKEYIREVLSPSVRINKFLLIETCRGKKAWEIKADNAEVFKDEAKLKNIKVKFFLEGDNFFTIVANNGKINTLSKDFTVTGDVVINSDKELNLQTDTLSWNSQKEEISTNSSVKITQNNFIITGEGLKLLPRSQRAEILRNVKIIINND